MHQKVDFFSRTNIIRVTEPNTPLNDADHVGSFNFKENYIKSILRQALETIVFLECYYV